MRTIAAAVVSLLLLLTGCSATGEGLGSAPVAAPLPGAARDEAGAAPASGEGGPVPYAEGSERMVARSANLTLVVDDLTGAAARIRGIAEAMDGWVANESLALDGPDASVAGGSWLSISVPASRLDEATDQVAALGTVRTRGATADDVTEAVVDTDARIRSLEASVTRLEELVGRAGSVADIAAVERELADRQAQLEALKAQRLQLAGAVERATLSVSLLTPTQSSATNPVQTGWARGWAAFLDSVSVLITVVAALLPFLLVAALIAVPVLVWRRRRRVRAAAAVTPERTAAEDAPAAPEAQA